MISYVNTAPVVTSNENPHKLGPNTVKGVSGLSITQIVMGALCLIFEIVLVVRGQNSINLAIAPGIWNGIFILIVGVIGVLAAQKNHRGLIIAYMVVNIVASVAMVEFTSLTGIAIGVSGGPCYFYFYGTCNNATPEYILNILILIMGLSQFIITIVAACLCCGPACCNSAGRVHTVVYHNGMQQQQQSATHSVMVGHQAYGQPQVTYSHSQGQTGLLPNGQQPVVGSYQIQQPPNYYAQQQQNPSYYAQQQQNPGYYAQQQQQQYPPVNSSEPQNAPPQESQKMKH